MQVSSDSGGFVATIGACCTRCMKKYDGYIDVEDPSAKMKAALDDDLTSDDNKIRK